MAMTLKNTINQEVKRLQEVRRLLDSLEKEEKALKGNISAYMQEHGMEAFKTSTCTAKFRHVKELKLDKTLGLSEEDLIDISMKQGWTDCVKLQLNKKAYHEKSKSVNNGESVFIENDRKDLIFTYKD